MEKNSTPKIRFRGFNEPWVTKRINDVSTSYSGGTPSVVEKAFYGGNIPFIRSGEISKNDTEIKITEDGLNNSSAKMVSKGDILYALYGATSGEVSISKINGAINQAVLAIIPKEGYSGVFINYHLRKDKKRITETYLQGGQGNLSGGIVNSLNLHLPVYSEQIKIGSFINDLDLINQEKNDELEKLQSVKQACMERMFPREGETTPELRFKGFNDDWVPFKLGEVGRSFSSLSGKSKEDFGHGDARYVTYMNVFTNPVSDIKEIEPIEIDNSQNEVQYGDVFFTTSSETPNEVGMSSMWLGKDRNVYLNSFCFGYRFSIDFYPFFIAYLFRSPLFRERITLLAQGISRYNISKNKAMDIVILMPNSLVEQKKIGNYFRHLDELIAAKRQEIEKLQDIKQSLLDKMFV